MFRLLLMHGILHITLILLCLVHYNKGTDFCQKPDKTEDVTGKCGLQSHFSRSRYILYDVNPAEGFNLRRDVYIRIAVFIKNLIQEEKDFMWKLVLPPWGNLYHWRSRNIGVQAQIPWGTFFDLKSLQRYIPVIELYDFIEEYSLGIAQTELDIVYILQNDEEMFKTLKFEDKNRIEECTKLPSRYQQLDTNRYIGYFWGYRNITAKNVKCVTFHGTVSNLKQNLNSALYRSVMFDHLEIPLHDYYGSKEYWMARRSMRYSDELYDIAKKFRAQFLNSTDKNDNTERPDDWMKEKEKRDALGGPYLCTHLRRRDFAASRPSLVPSIKIAAKQLKQKLDELNLTTLFVATDAEPEEFQELKEYLSDYVVLKFVPSTYELHKFKDGGVAIIDQIICSYARYFIGTNESTFTFRIQEDREIIGFPSETTFNRLCQKNKKCSFEGQWEIIW